MKHLFILIAAFLFHNISIESRASEDACKDFQNASLVIEAAEEINVLTEKNWNDFDVITHMDQSRCLNSIVQEMIRVRGKTYWRLWSNWDDGCDGGNTYGVIYSSDLQTPIAHIYDGDVYCPPFWRQEMRASH